MATSTIEESVAALLNRRVVEDRTRGTMNPQVESRALFDAITLNLLLLPRSVLYVAALAKNQLLTSIQDELDAIDAVKGTISALGNVSYVISDTTDLVKARNSLTQLGDLEQVSSENGAFKRFDSAVGAFLSKRLSKSIRKRGTTELIRPGSEAAQDLADEFVALVSTHLETIGRLNALAVGVDNFMSSPLSSILGSTATDRARADVESMLAEIEADSSAASARDIAVRLFSARAAVKAVSSTPSPRVKVLDSGSELPTGYVLTGISDPAPARVTSSTSPFALPAAPALTVQVNSTVLGPYTFPQVNRDLSSRSSVIGTVLSPNVAVPAGYYLFFTIGTTNCKVGPFTPGTYADVPTLVTEINTQLGIAGLGGSCGADEFCEAGSSRIILFTTDSSITIGSTFIDATTGVVYVNSLDVLFGFAVGQNGVLGVIPVEDLVVAFNQLFGSVTTATRNVQDFTVESLSTAVGVTMVITAQTEFGLAGTYVGESDTFRLLGSVLGVTTDPVDPRPLLDLGDLVTTPSGTAIVSVLSPTRVTLDSAQETFSGNLSVESALLAPADAVAVVIGLFLGEWAKSQFSRGLSKLDTAVARLSGNSTPTLRAEAVTVLNSLRLHFSNLQTALQDPTTTLPSNCATREREVVNGIVTSLLERKYDRATDLFLRCQILEMLSLTSETASYAGAFSAAMSTLSRIDLSYPNRSLDEGSSVLGIQKRTGQT